jgi:hypothetical protein
MIVAVSRTDKSYEEYPYYIGRVTSLPSGPAGARTLSVQWFDRYLGRASRTKWKEMHFQLLMPASSTSEALSDAVDEPQADMDLDEGSEEKVAKTPLAEADDWAYVETSDTQVIDLSEVLAFDYASSALSARSGAPIGPKVKGKPTRVACYNLQPEFLVAIKRHASANS